MTKAEGAKLGGAVSNRLAFERRGLFLSYLDSGVNKKRAAHLVGVSYRTATRYKSGETGV
jgi:hypothetical protein